MHKKLLFVGLLLIAILLGASIFINNPFISAETAITRGKITDLKFYHVIDKSGGPIKIFYQYQANGSNYDDSTYVFRNDPIPYSGQGVEIEYLVNYPERNRIIDRSP